MLPWHPNNGLHFTQQPMGALSPFLMVTGRDSPVVSTWINLPSNTSQSAGIKPTSVNFTRSPGTRFLDSMVDHSPLRFTMYFGAKFFLNASIASEAFDSSCQPTKPLMACSAQSAEKSMQSNWMASIPKKCEQNHDWHLSPKMFQKLKALVTLLFLHLIVTPHPARSTCAGCAVYRPLFPRDASLLPPQRLSTWVFPT